MDEMTSCLRPYIGLEGVEAELGRRIGTVWTESIREHSKEHLRDTCLLLTMPST